MLYVLYLPKDKRNCYDSKRSSARRTRVDVLGDGGVAGFCWIGTSCIGAGLIRCESSRRAHLLGDIGVFGVAACDGAARVGVGVAARSGAASVGVGVTTSHSCPGGTRVVDSSSDVSAVVSPVDRKWSTCQ